jgi:hypothetical protein
MNAAASSLIEAIKASFGGVPTGNDWDYVPSGTTSWFKYGSGGVNGWGSLCGVPNGCIAVLNLMNLSSTTLMDQIMYYACQTEFPIKGLHDLYLSDPSPSSWAREPMPDGDVLAYTVANSPLCHASVSKWAYAAGVNMTAPGTTTGTAHKTDRCAKVAAGVASFTAGLINGATSSLKMPDMTAQCYGCHQTTSHPAQQGKMDCLECHNSVHAGKYLSIEDVWTTDGAGNAKDTFHAGDPYQIKVRFAVMGAGSCLVRTYKSYWHEGSCGNHLLSNSATLSTGTYEWTWSGTIGGTCTGQAGVVMHLVLFDYAGGAFLGDKQKVYKFKIV